MMASTPQVSERMSRHPRKDTGPELALRRLMFSAGLRYRVHMRVPDLPRRTIDVAFPRKKIAVFIDGCFWHGCPQHGMLPRSNHEWWRQKIEHNRRRDVETSSHLNDLGWDVFRFWCHEDFAIAVEIVATRVREKAT